MSLNIDGSEDAFFRYKMPDIIVKVEGRGNGIKTVIPNMADIGQSLHRDPGYPTKFFATELGALSQWDEKRNVGIVNGEHDKGTLSRLLRKFIDTYVLCPQCNNPETDLKVKRGMIYYKCKACGSAGISNNTHKLATYILKHPPPSSKKDKEKGEKKDKKEKKDRKEKGSKKTKSSEDLENSSNGKETRPEKTEKARKKADNVEEDEGEIHFEITEEMENMKVNEDVEIADPVEMVRNAIAECSKVPEKAQAITKLRQEQGYDEAECFVYVVKALVTDSLLKNVQTNLKFIQCMMLPERDGQLRLLACLEERCETQPNYLKELPKALMVLYDQDVLEEEVILEWHEKGISQLLALADVPAQDAARQAAESFIEWLKNAEEAESDDDE